jgi:conjugal transfer pilus assembly protein TraB
MPRLPPLPPSSSALDTPLQIHHYTAAEKPKEAPAPTNAPLYLPAGSLLSGVFLTGLDAPTHQGARREPFPATLRLHKTALLPNHFRAEVRECFLIVSGFGDLSAERAYLRGETLSCIRADGGVIEAKIDAYAVGEDGKAGVRGRLVSKQGQIIAKSMMAGFLSGASKAFDIRPVPTINTQPDHTTPYQPVLSNDLFQGAAAQGFSQALDRIAKFYLDLAENLFPVIEVDAGRQIDLVVTRGVSLSSPTPSRRTE